MDVGKKERKEESTWRDYDQLREGLHTVGIQEVRNPTLDDDWLENAAYQQDPVAPCKMGWGLSQEQIFNGITDSDSRTRGKAGLGMKLHGALTKFLQDPNLEISRRLVRTEIYKQDPGAPGGAPCRMRWGVGRGIDSWIAISDSSIIGQRGSRTKGIKDEGDQAKGIGEGGSRRCSVRCVKRVFAAKLHATRNQRHEPTLVGSPRSRLWAPTRKNVVAPNPRSEKMTETTVAGRIAGRHTVTSTQQRNDSIKSTWGRRKKEETIPAMCL
ncbi:hypothetical protein B0H34DRAFT_678972 [Crassisporium funariophilum]|nr:hypothetical protein B0H34DRAFT_678972 [Crassisporium funariophilum]